MIKNPIIPTTNLIAFSHLRWDFVFQRPQHLLSRFAKYAHVFYFEEPVFDDIETPFLNLSKRADNLTVIVPHVPSVTSKEEVNEIQIELLAKFFEKSNPSEWTFWYYTPMALPFTDHYKPKLVVFDVMDELSAFKFAPVELVALEKQLLAKADVVFTGGQSLYEAKQRDHDNIHCFPSSIDKVHFSKARTEKVEPEDQVNIKGKKIGFYGVLDERFEIDLVREIASKEPTWQIILIGPVVKIEEQTLPRNKNIHYLGPKSYSELPAYLSGWDIALIPFALNESTRFISPTKTPEYLSAGLPVVSTPIRDVVKTYGVQKLTHIASDSDEFIASIHLGFEQKSDEEWLHRVDDYLADMSWDNTFSGMLDQMNRVLNNSKKISIAS